MTKVTIDVPEKDFRELKRYVRWGLRQALVSAVINLVVDAIREDGEIVAGAILDGKYRLKRDET